MLPGRKALRLDEGMRDYLAPHMLMLEQLARRSDDFDVVHLHVDYMGFGLLRRLDLPYRDDPARQARPAGAAAAVSELFDDAPVVSISDSQREPLPQANYIATVHHGLPERLLLPGFGAGGYLAFLGRISPEKAPDAAIRIAAAAGMKLKIAAKVDKVDQAYFERADRTPARASPMSSSWARSATSRRRSSWAMPRHCSFRSPGGSRSGW